jgi:hypothetical protein
METAWMDEKELSAIEAQFAGSLRYAQALNLANNYVGCVAIAATFEEDTRHRRRSSRQLSGGHGTTARGNSKPSTLIAMWPAQLRLDFNRIASLAFRNE